MVCRGGDDGAEGASLVATMRRSTDAMRGVVQRRHLHAPRVEVGVGASAGEGVDTYMVGRRQLGMKVWV